VRILKPGQNCWRIERAPRAAVLVDGDAYFAAFREAAARARHSIIIAGWDVDSRTDLAPRGAHDGLPRPLGEFLDALVRRRPALHVHVLGWDFSMLYALEREFLPMYTFGWRTHGRLHYHLDDRHPPGGSHHQKIAVIDGVLAFVGGLDFAKGRWDTPGHEPDEPRRKTPEGVPYPPFHDIQLMVDGDAATAVAELVRERWEKATGHAPAEHAAVEAAWPKEVRPDFEDVNVGIVRTVPEYKGDKAVTEVKQLYLDAIEAARASVYLENQYFTSSAVSGAIEARLRQQDAPEIVVVSRKSCDGWLEQETMEVLRARRLRHLRARDARKRFRAYYPDQPGLGEECIKLHSKLMIVDERLLRIGSANLNNRSMGLDTECDLVIEARNADHERAIGHARLSSPTKEPGKRRETRPPRSRLHAPESEDLPVVAGSRIAQSVAGCVHQLDGHGVVPSRVGADEGLVRRCAAGRGPEAELSLAVDGTADLRSGETGVAVAGTRNPRFRIDGTPRGASCAAR